MTIEYRCECGCVALSDERSPVFCTRHKTPKPMKAGLEAGIRDSLLYKTAKLWRAR
jgi:hypothetical protein